MFPQYIASNCVLMFLDSLKKSISEFDSKAPDTKEASKTPENNDDSKSSDNKKDSMVQMQEEVKELESLIQTLKAKVPKSVQLRKSR